MINLNEKILDSSILLLNKNGINKFTMRKLIKEMKVSSATLYRAVSNKEGIYSIICEHICQKIHVFEAVPKLFIKEVLTELRTELLKIRNSAAIFYETIPVYREHMEFKQSIIKALLAQGMDEEYSFSTACLLINYVLFSVWDEEFYSSLSGAKNARGIISFYKNMVKDIDYGSHFQHGLNLLLNGLIDV